MSAPTSGEARVLAVLEESRAREKDQTLFYRSLAASAEEVGDARLVERLNELHADEQHHLSRLTARVLELGGSPIDLRSRPSGAVQSLEGWEDEARRREDVEVRWYEGLLSAEGTEGTTLDAETVGVLEDILVGERKQRDHLGGKWMSA
jgi:bacterioferritin (cytochrome b1)